MLLMAAAEMQRLGRIPPLSGLFGPGVQLPGMSQADLEATTAAQQPPFGAIARAVDPAKFDAAVGSMPQSQNIEDRRGHVDLGLLLRTLTESSFGSSGGKRGSR